MGTKDEGEKALQLSKIANLENMLHSTFYRFKHNLEDISDIS